VTRRLSTPIKFTIVLLLFFLVQPELVLAHRMVVELVEPGTIVVRYDDGTKSGIAIVTAFDEKGNLLFEKYVDDKGFLHYDANIIVYQIIADDGIGHRTTWSNEINDEQLDIPILVRALLGISLLLFIAAFFYYRRHN